MNSKVQEASSPWWKFGHVWLVIAGPAVVVVAGFFTLFLALRWPDPVVADDYYRKGIDINKTLESNSGSLTPAVQARNHAATGTVPDAKVSPRP
jgi:hypothetical protein